MNLFDVYIIDEASMMNDALYKFVKESSANLGTQIIVVGDPAQLKPVKQKTLSKSFSEVDGLSELTIVERTGDNPLLAESMEVRNTTSGEPFTKISAVNEKGEKTQNPITPLSLSSPTQQDLSHRQSCRRWLVRETSSPRRPLSFPSLDPFFSFQNE